jgi:nicotinamidase/pyrazinamidase
VSGAPGRTTRVKVVDRNLIFWDVDTQVDFMLPEGKLYVPGAETIIPTLAKLTNWAAQHEVLAIASADALQPGDEEFRQYPPHCLAGTPGQKKIPETSLTPQFTIPDRYGAGLPDIARYQQIVIEKQKFDVFTNPNTEAFLAQLGKPQIVLYGVVTEICVSAAARGLLDRGYRVTVVEDAIRTWIKKKHWPSSKKSACEAAESWLPGNCRVRVRRLERHSSRDASFMQGLKLCSTRIAPTS